jgi:hypothetical protein
MWPGILSGMQDMLIDKVDGFIDLLQTSIEFLFGDAERRTDEEHVPTGVGLHSGLL